jgi:hypothetical protein
MPKPKSKSNQFLATIYRIWMMRHVDVPEEVSSELIEQAGKGRLSAPHGKKLKYIPVVSTVAARSTRTTLVPAGAGRYRLQVNTAQRKAAHADTGDVIRVALTLDTASRTLPVPRDLQAALKNHPKAATAFKKLAPGMRRQFIMWFDAAKSPAARQKRLNRAMDILLERALLSTKGSKG